MPEDTWVTASKADSIDSVYNLLESNNLEKNKWLAKKVNEEEPEGEAWVRFDFGSRDIPESRVVTGVSIKSSQHYRKDPVSVRVWYYDSEGEVWEKLDPIDLAWEVGERYTELKFELQKKGKFYPPPETTSMKFEFTAKDDPKKERQDIAVQ